MSDFDADDPWVITSLSLLALLGVIFVVKLWRTYCFDIQCIYE